jgi:hypothetical protein
MAEFFCTNHQRTFFRRDKESWCPDCITEVRTQAKEEAYQKQVADLIESLHDSDAGAPNQPPECPRHREVGLLGHAQRCLVDQFHAILDKAAPEYDYALDVVEDFCQYAHDWANRRQEEGK